MQQNTLSILLTVGLLFSSTVNSVPVPTSTNQPPPLLLLSEHSPPGEYLDENGQVRGATVQLIKLLMNRLGEQGNFSIQPWARSLAIAQNSRNTVLFETSRTAERERKFNWVGPLKHYDFALYARSDMVSGKLSVEQLKQSYIACAARGSYLETQLLESGFIKEKNLILTTKDNQCAPMLVQGRVDLIALNTRSQQQVEQQLPDHVNLIEVMHLKVNELYLAFSKDIPQERLQRWQLALEQSYLDGSMRKLYAPFYREQTIQFLEQFAQQQAKRRKAN